MDSRELECLINKDSNVLHHYSGSIYSYDTLPDQLVSNTFYICNDKSSKSNWEIPGHWITFLRFPKYCVYLDPFGLEIEPQFLLPLANKCDVPIFYLNVHLQNINCSTCGMHSIVFCSFFSYGWSVEQILEQWYDIYDSKGISNDPYFFDHKAQLFIIIFYGEYRSIFYDF